MRVKPASRRAASEAGSTLSGLASVVTSASGARPNVARTSRRTAARSATGSSVGVPPPKKTVDAGRDPVAEHAPGQRELRAGGAREGLARAPAGQLGRGVGVEVAVAAAGRAERDVDVDAEGARRAPRRAPRRGARRRGAGGRRRAAGPRPPVKRLGALGRPGAGTAPAWWPSAMNSGTPSTSASVRITSSGKTLPSRRRPSSRRGGRGRCPGRGRPPARPTSGRPGGRSRSGRRARAAGRRAPRPRRGWRS